jgi:hypothetical protein
MSMNDDVNGKGVGSDQTGRWAEQLADSAKKLSAALAGVMRNLEGHASEHETRAKLAELSRAFEMQSMRAQDIASGENGRRKKPLVDAMGRACAGGGEQDWREAMACLAQYALDETRPAWYAGAMLSHMKVDVEALSAQAAMALVGPIDIERKLGSPSYLWDWIPGLEAGQKEWAEASMRAGVAP